jgi:hypothetical protein
MNTIKKYLRGADLFGISFTFRYKNNEKYQTALGGKHFIYDLGIIFRDLLFHSFFQ